MGWVRLPRLHSLLVAIAVYLAGIGIGLASPGLLARSYIEGLRRIALHAYTLPPYGLYLLILSNNLAIAMLAFISGVLIVPPLLILFLNGVLLGAVASIFTRWYTIFEFLRLILPHGVLEIPAFILAAAGGLDLALETLTCGVRCAVRKIGEESASLLLATVLLALAAVIETLGIYMHK